MVEMTGYQMSLGLRPQELIEMATMDPDRGPFTSAIFETVSEVPNAEQRSLLQWRSIREKLRSAGTPNVVLGLIDGLVPRAHLSGDAIAVVADSSRVVRSEHLPSIGGSEIARASALPSLTRLLLWRQRMPVHMVVLVDRRGADLLTFRWGRAPLMAEAGDADWPMHKAKPGGWSQRRYQTRAQNTWEHNAHEVSAQLVRLASRESPAFIGVGGDVRAIEMLAESLPGETAGLLRRLSAGRAPDGSEDVVNDEVEALLETEVAAVEDSVAAALANLQGQNLAVTGPRETFAALSEGRVDTLFVHDDPEDQRTAWFSSNPALVGAERADVEAAGESRPREGRMTDVAIRGAFGTSARAYVVDRPEALREGIAGIVRWPEPV